jgi:hypothetical protein
MEFFPSRLALSCRLRLSLEFHSVLVRQKQRGVGPGGFGDDPDDIVRGCSVTAQQTKAFFQAELVFLAIFFWNCAPVARYMAGEEFHRGLAGFFESSQRAGCSHRAGPSQTAVYVLSFALKYSFVWI